MDSSEVTVDALEKRVRSLEEKVFGRNKDEATKVIDTLMVLHNKLQSIVTGREKVTSVFTKLDDLEKFLNPQFSDNLGLPDASKLNLILMSENMIRDTVASLQTVKDLDQYMNSEHIKATPSFHPKLKQINKATMDLVENISDFDEDTKKLASEYNTLMTSLSQQIVLWDSILAELEKQKTDGSPDKEHFHPPSKSRLHYLQNEF